MKHTSLKRNHKGILNILAGIGAILALGSVDTAEARRQSSFGLNLSYQSGRAMPGFVGAPFFGYGGAANGFGAINGCFTGAAGGGFIPGPIAGHPGGGGGFIPGPVPPMMPRPPMAGMPRPPIPPMPPLIPPHVGGGPFLGSSIHGGMGIPGPVGHGCQTICAGGVPYAYGPPPMMGPVPGGPLLGPAPVMGPGAWAQNHGMHQGMHAGRSTASASSSGIIHVPAGGTTIIDMSGKNAWEMNDTADIMWSTALGLGMTTTNVFPYHGPRNAVTNLNLMYSPGPRNYNFQPRPHAAP